MHDFFTSAPAGSVWSALRPGRLTPRRNPRYLLDTRLGEIKSRSGRCGKVKILNPVHELRPLGRPDRTPRHLDKENTNFKRIRIFL
jgi:hypothetical protein